MKISRLFFTGIVAVCFPLLMAVCGCAKTSGDDYYWGHGFGMGYGSGCYEDRDSMMGNLGITEKQARQIADIDAKYRKLYYDNRGDFNEIDALRKKHRDEIDKVLNSSQRSKFNHMYSNRWGSWGRDYKRRHMGDYYGNGYGMGYGSGCFENRESMKDSLGLSEAQAKKIADIDSEYRDQYYKYRGDYDKIESLREKHRAAIEKVLNAEQLKKYDDLYNNRWRGWGPMMGSGHGMMGY